MSLDLSQAPPLELAHILFIDIVGYSKLPIDEQRRAIRHLQRVVQASAEFARSQEDGDLLCIPTGDGMALAFRRSPESPVRCAMEVSRAFRQNGELQIRIGIHTGPVYRISDINSKENLAGGGMNLAQRVMDCGDGGHILMSSSVAEVLQELSGWSALVHYLGEVEVKHRVRVQIFNFYNEEVGNPAKPQKLLSSIGLIKQLAPSTIEQSDLYRQSKSEEGVPSGAEPETPAPANATHNLSTGLTLRKDAHLGPYVIICQIGAGGMGEVYRARDTRLRREVAIKVLPGFISESEELARFEREGRAVAALNHPNILAVFDIGSEEGIHYIVTELLEGTSLRELLRSGRLAPARATAYATQIAQGLASAHEKGFIHRDIKPENIFITKDGRVKILDFGLAKQVGGIVRKRLDASGEAQLQTSAGAILGTVSYMAPEQVRGHEMDHRADIFALGAVLFEMLTGRRAFQRESWVETANAILTDEPPELSAEPEQGFPLSLRRLVYHCLEKDRDNRFESAKDLWFALESISMNTTRFEPQVVRQAKRSIWRIGGIVGLVGGSCAAAGLLGLSWGRIARDRQPSYERVTFRNGPISAARFGPYDQSVIYSASLDSPTSKLYRSGVDGSDMRSLDLPSADLLAVSHSGELAIIIKGRLARVPLLGGTPREVVDNVEAADWSPDGTQLAVGRLENSKTRLEFPIGNVLYESAGYISHIRVSPEGDAVAFMNHPVLGDDRGTIALVDLKGHIRTLTPEWIGEQGLAWSPDGKEIWFTATSVEDWNRGLYAVTRSGKLRSVLTIPGAMYLEDVASDGRVLFKRDDRRYEIAKGMVGTGTSLVSGSEIQEASSISRDGKYVLIGDYSTSHYYVMLAQLDGSPPIRLGDGLAGDISPDDKWVTSIPTDMSKVQLLPTGLGSPKSVAAPEFQYRTALWTADGNKLVIIGNQTGRPVRSWIQDLNGGYPRAITPEGIVGSAITVNHSDYVSAADAGGARLLFPVDGVGIPKRLNKLRPSDSVIGGFNDSDVVLVCPDPGAIPIEIEKVDISTGRREPFLIVGPTNSPGVESVGLPRFSRDARHYVYNQVRESAVLYVGSGLR